MRIVVGLMALLLCLTSPAVQAANLVYVPMDDRPVNLEYVLDSVRAAGSEIVSPPADFIAGRELLRKIVFHNRDRDLVFIIKHGGHSDHLLPFAGRRQRKTAPWSRLAPTRGNSANSSKSFTKTFFAANDTNHLR